MTRKKVTKEAEVLAILTETPLAGFINVLRTGEFQPPPSDSVAPHEAVIGELTDNEKAIWSALELLKKKGDEIADANNERVKVAKRKGEKVDDLQVFLNRAEHEATMHMLLGLRELMWFTIKKRIGTPAMEAGGLGIRNGYQLVTVPPQKQDESEMFAELLMSGHAGGRLALAAMLGGIGR